jgi:enterobactin synthetase component F
MSAQSPSSHLLPAEQQAIRAKCFHPSGEFVEFPQDALERSIPDRFEEIARKGPDGIAIKRPDEQITHDQLNRSANRLARTILTKKPHDQTPVVLFIEPGLALIMGYPAILKAGHRALHVDPRAPRDRVALLMGESQTARILTHRENRAVALEWAEDATALLDVESTDAHLRDENLGLAIAPEDYAHAAYASGSAGRAKGALKSHRFALPSAMDDEVEAMSGEKAQGRLRAESNPEAKANE